MMSLTALTIITLVWLASVSIQGVPLLFAPIARVKRAQVIAITVLTLLAIVTAWIGREYLHSVSGYSLLVACVAGSIGYVILKRLDYYVDDLLRELLLVVSISSAISIMTSVWFWGIEQNPSLIGIRIAIALIPLLILTIVWLTQKESSLFWMAGIYIAMLVIKTVILPWWLIWTPILSLLFAVLAGYTVYWQITTTKAEKLFAWNIEPAKIWLMLAGLAGLLVLAF